MKKIGKKLMEGLAYMVRTVQPVAPAVLLGALVAAVLMNYNPPEAEKYKVSAAESTWDNLNLLSRTEDSSEDTSEAAAETGKGSFDLADGTYRGTGTGFGGEITVDVTISAKAITSIDIVSAPGETDSFFSRAKGVIDSMISAQSTKVDVVSGATYSSNGIIAAVENALYGTVSTQATASASGQTGASAPSVAKIDDSNAVYKDGDYTGIAQGFGGPIKVKVTVKDGKIADVKILSASGETSSYLNKAKSLIKTIVSKNSTNVSAVSGATYSSNGIINAVRNALSGAKAGSKEEKTSQPDKTTKKKKDKGTSRDSGDYEDGTYTGSAQGFGGPIKVQVKIKKGKIASVKILSAEKETKSFFDKAKALTRTIVNKQTADVSAISGATYSSNGIINAVKNALAKAKKKSSGSTTKKKKTTEKATEKKKENTHTPATSAGQYADGTYQGAGEGFKGNITVSVIIKNGKITEIKIVSREDDDPYFTNAKNGILSKVIDKQSTAVDTVSGATYSSEGILSAIDNALKKAVKNPASTTAKKGDTTMEQKESTGKKDDTTTEKKDDTESGKTTEKEDATETEKTTEKKDDTESEENTTESKSAYKDGTYSVSVTCQADGDGEFADYEISMDVVIQSDKITAVNNISGGSGYVKADQWYLNEAKSGVVSSIISKGTPNVSAVSGATCSSNAIIEGCRKALEKAKN